MLGAIDSFVVKDIRDDQGYLEALGQTDIANVKRDATIGQAMAARDATIKSAEANQEGQTAKFQVETKITEADKNYKVQKAAYDTETNRRQAEAELGYVLQQNITSQQVKQVPATVEALTGVDLVETISDLPMVKGGGEGKRRKEGEDQEEE